MTRLRGALQQLEIVGVATNQALLLSILQHPDYRRGAVATDFLSLQRDQLAHADAPPGSWGHLIGALWCAVQGGSAASLWEQRQGWRMGAAPRSLWRFIGGVVELLQIGTDTYVATMADVSLTLRLMHADAQSLIVESDGRVYRVRVQPQADALHLFEAGSHATVHRVSVEDALQMDGAIEEGSLLTPLPGTIVAVHVRAGETVARGAPLITVEAMKMEHTLTAPYPGMVRQILFALRDRVPAGAILIELAAEPG